MAYNKTKTDPGLGVRVHEFLKSKGLETPVIESVIAQAPGDKITKIEQCLTQAMQTLGMDLTDDSLMETPKRIAKMWVLEQYWGLVPENFPKCTTVNNRFGADEMIIEKCSVNSNCEHHFVPLGSFGNPKLGAWIAYFPKDKVLGLSKLPRILDYFAHRPQIQERLTIQTAEALKYILDTDDVAVVIKAVHMCVSTRGIEDLGADTTTSYLGGRFKLPEVRAEFLNFVQSA